MQELQRKLESAKNALQDEFKNYYHTREYPLGNAASDRKIQEYVIACSLENYTEMWDWFEENIINKYDVTGVDRTTLDFARRVLDRFINSN